jgi:hypothetical protein
MEGVPVLIVRLHFIPDTLAAGMKAANRFADLYDDACEISENCW